jgi:hypothetical protein
MRMKRGIAIKYLVGTLLFVAGLVLWAARPTRSIPPVATGRVIQRSDGRVLEVYLHNGSERPLRVRDQLSYQMLRDGKSLWTTQALFHQIVRANDVVGMELPLSETGRVIGVRWDYGEMSSIDKMGLYCLDHNYMRLGWFLFAHLGDSNKYPRWKLAFGTNIVIKSQAEIDAQRLK